MQPCNPLENPSGGSGGGGAGAGIGTNGGHGGGNYNGSISNKDRTDGAACGTIIKLGSIDVIPKGGAAGTGGAAGGNFGGWIGGNGGDGGGKGADVGQGGAGGSCGSNGFGAGDGHYSQKGSVAATGASKSYTASTEFSDATSYTVAFGDTQTYTYSFLFERTIQVPDCTSAPGGKFFLGWKVAQSGRCIVSGTHPLTSVEAKLYQPGESVTLTAGTCGDITLTAILRDKVGILSADTGSMAFPADPVAEPATYYDYTIQTTLDGANADMGPLTLTGGDTRTLTADANGHYAMTLSTSGSYTVTSAKYPLWAALAPSKRAAARRCILKR